jgi:hypothetical protein
MGSSYPTLLSGSAAGQINVSGSDLVAVGDSWDQMVNGSERLTIKSFASDWMRPTLQKLMLPEIPLCRKSHGGSRNTCSGQCRRTHYMKKGRSLGVPHF